MTLSTLKVGREGLLVEVPDTTICNLINDFQLVGVALDDTSLSFVVSGMLNPLQQNTPNGTLTQVGFIQWQRKQRSTAEP